ncbi:hypothetical protein Tco_0968565 [Tanacetum coccineum]
MESGSYWLDKVWTSIWRDVRTLAIEEAYTTKYSIHPGADTMLCGFRLTNRWLSMKKDIASCGSKYLAYSEEEVEYQGSSGLLLQPELPELDPLLTKLEFPQELSKVHNTFHVSNLRKCYANEPLAVPLDRLHFDDKLHFVEEPIEIIDREVKRLKRSRIPLVKVRWNTKRGPEFTWEREDQFKEKYPHLFTKTTPSSSAAS